MKGVFLLLLFLFILTVSAETEFLLNEGMRGQMFQTRSRVRRQWMNAAAGWTGWRCSGFNGLFLDCVGRK
ncbi:hypothetical protein QR680_001222 [Steinernema hermaphroditum]|uniref:Uncharacterized protein n=1 Tax=Steinernema hermaphroditum TaxID=289476 RepID=A0AA39LFG1_9BILA|nr:hypothetical protein QR680_001222 [Steinernema hermaphroditum]